MNLTDHLFCLIQLAKIVHTLFMEYREHIIILPLFYFTRLVSRPLFSHIQLSSTKQ